MRVRTEEGPEPVHITIQMNVKLAPFTGISPFYLLKKCKAASTAPLHKEALIMGEKLLQG